MSRYETLIAEEQDGILTITINREDKLNALNLKLFSELKDVVANAEGNKGIKGVIITGKGSKAFAAGADIAEFADFEAAKGKEMAAGGHDVLNSIERGSKPYIAAVNGFALGGGCELAMACHLRIASEEAKFGQPEVNLGIIPGYGGTQRLVQLIGKGKALELLMTGDMIGAEEAHRLGLANHVVPAEELLNTCKKILNKIGSKAPLAIAKVIDCVATHFEDGKDGFQREIDLFAESMNTEDFHEGTQAFLGKRKAEFKGE